MILRAWTGGVPIAGVQARLIDLADVDWDKMRKKWQ
jgi:hypothetical protein